jgi:hypothetical protein
MKGLTENGLYPDQKRLVATANQGRILLREEKKQKKIHYTVDIRIISMYGKIAVAGGSTKRFDVNLK